MDVERNHPLSKELIERVLDELGMNHGRVSGDVIHLSFEREEEVGSDLYFLLDVQGDDKDELSVLGFVQPMILGDNCMKALVACNEFNKMCRFDRAYITMKSETEAKLYFSSPRLLHNGTTEKFLRDLILNIFATARAFFSVNHSERHLY